MADPDFLDTEDDALDPKKLPSPFRPLPPSRSFKLLDEEVLFGAFGLGDLILSAALRLSEFRLLSLPCLLTTFFTLLTFFPSARMYISPSGVLPPTVADEPFLRLVVLESKNPPRSGMIVYLPRYVYPDG